MIDESNSPQAGARVATYCGRRYLSPSWMWQNSASTRQTKIFIQPPFVIIIIYMYVHYLFCLCIIQFMLTILPPCLHILISWWAVSRSFMHGGRRHIASYSSGLDEYPWAVERPCTFRYGSAWRTTSVPHIQNRQWPPRTWTSRAAPAPKMLQCTTQEKIHFY